MEVLNLATLEKQNEITSKLDNYKPPKYIFNTESFLHNGNVFKTVLNVSGKGVLRLATSGGDTDTQLKVFVDGELVFGANTKTTTATGIIHQSELLSSGLFPYVDATRDLTKLSLKSLTAGHRLSFTNLVDLDANIVRLISGDEEMHFNSSLTIEIMNARNYASTCLVRYGLEI